MSYSVELRKNESVIWEVWGADYNPETETEAALRDEMRCLEEAGKPVVLIGDVRAIKLSFDDILYLASNGIPKEVTGHPNYRGEILISSDEVVADSAAGLDNEVFGFIKLHVVATPESALALARQLLA
jgi:hypothetical protein